MKVRICILVLAVLVAGSMPADASIVALKRDAGLTDGRSFASDLGDAIGAGTVTVYSGAGVISDAFLYTDTGWAQHEIYRNRGASASAGQWAPVLVKLGVDALAGFAGSTINKAQIRFYTGGGNNGMYHTGDVTASDWIEGGSDNGFPGAAGGVSGAHPLGYNTDAYQTADGTPVDVGYPPNMSMAPFSWANDQPFGTAKDGVSVVDGMFNNYWGVTPGQWDQYLTIDITSIVQLWANGTPNYGLFFDSTGNYSPYLSENSTNANWQPVLVMDYVPTPEPATLVLLALGSMVMIRRRNG